MIRVSEITKEYGSVHALRGVSFEIARGEVVGLLGPNGAGKTTTIRILTTYLTPSAGTASVAGHDIHREAGLVRKSIGYLPETPPLYPELSVREYLTFVGKIRGLRGAGLKRALERELERCGLEAMAGRLCSQLSKGFKQRVGIAQALIHEPEVLILDEPTSGLDPLQVLELRKLIAALQKKHTVVVSTHILAEVVATCSSVIILSGGRVVTAGSIAELTAEETLEQQFFRALSQAESEVQGTEVG